MKVLYESRPAMHNRSIVICCDKNFLPFACFLAEQVHSMKLRSDFDICICSLDKIQESVIERAPELRFIHIQIGDIFAGQSMPGRLGESAFLRLIIPNILQSDYKRMLYLDCDIYFSGGDIDSLLNLNLDGRPIAAVRDLKQWLKPRHIPREFEALGWGFRPYFNSGVLLIDTKAFLEGRVLEKCLDFGKKYGDKLHAHDQSLLNCVLRDEWAELSPIWNWQLAAYYPYFHQIMNPCFLHFVSHAKPWDSSKNAGVPPLVVNSYADYIGKNFPEIGQIKWAGEGLSHTVYDVWRKLWKHGVKAPPLIRYFNSFKGHMDVH